MRLKARIFFCGRSKATALSERVLKYYPDYNRYVQIFKVQVTDLYGPDLYISGLGHVFFPDFYGLDKYG